MCIEDKKALRKVLLNTRKNIPQEEKYRFDLQIGQQVIEYIKEKNPASVGVYLPIRNEPNLMDLYIKLAKIVPMALPITPNKDAPLEFVKWHPDDPLVKGDYNIDVPANCIVVPVPELVVIPCVGFTLDKYRLGYGGGYFDRTLAQNPQISTIGVAYDCLQTSFTTDPNDVSLDCIITESKIVI